MGPLASQHPHNLVCRCKEEHRGDCALGEARCKGPIVNIMLIARPAAEPVFEPQAEVASIRYRYQQHLRAAANGMPFHPSLVMGHPAGAHWSTPPGPPELQTSHGNRIPLGSRNAMETMPLTGQEIVSGFDITACQLYLTVSADGAVTIYGSDEIFAHVYHRELVLDRMPSPHHSIL